AGGDNPAYKAVENGPQLTAGRESLNSQVSCAALIGAQGVASSRFCMQIPLHKELKIGAYILKQKLRGVKHYPLVLMLEPLFRCNLACSGCGKIDYPAPILNQRLSVQECLDAVDECGAPVVAIPGGEPLIHKEIG